MDSIIFDVDGTLWNSTGDRSEEPGNNYLRNSRTDRTVL